VWGDGFDPDLPVLRVEFEFGREGLREFGIETPAEALAAAGALWASATMEWLTYRCPTADQTRSRWPVAAEWQQIQRATLRQDAVGLDRMHAGRMRGSLRKLLPGLTGYVAKFASLVGTESISETCAALPAYLRDYEMVSGIAFEERVRRKTQERLDQ
jgi:hypothetical protein